MTDQFFYNINQMDTIMNYKETLLLPQTSFPMKGNLPKNEPLKYKIWNEQRIYDKMLKNRAEAKESFTLHDGPPYANGYQ